MAAVLLTLWSPRRIDTLITALACSLLTVLGLFLSPAGGVLWIVIVNRALAIVVIWVTALLLLRGRKLMTRIEEVSARLTAEEALRASEFRLAALFENGRDAIFF